MNTFFHHKRIPKYTLCRDSLGQHHLIDFCIVSADLFSTVSDVRVKRWAEVSTDHHLVVCIEKASKLLGKQKVFRPQNTYRIKWESLAEKEVRAAFADNIASKFKELPTSTESIETEWCLFRTAVITSAVADLSVLEKHKVVRIELFGGTRKLKRLIKYSGKPLAVCAEKGLKLLSSSKIPPVSL